MEPAAAPALIAELARRLSGLEDDGTVAITRAYPATRLYNGPYLAAAPDLIIGYADGYSRHLSRGAGCMLVRGQRAPVIGNVCMDMTMLDVTDIPGARAGDEVIVFGPGLGADEVARQAGTIPYEILTSISPRVRRVFLGG